MNYELLSRHRSALMGAAMLMVILFHVGGSRHDTLWFCMSRCGNVGVDMFLFLSGIGLWFAWTRGIAAAGRPTWRSLLTFYLRRYVRIYPAWLVMACLYYLPRWSAGRLDLTDTLLSITVNWGFWQHDELTFWFIPAIMMLYTVAPAYMELIRRHPVWRWSPVLAMTLCVLVQYWPPLHNAVGHLEIFFSRLPIFLLGVNAGLPVAGRRTLEPSVWWLLAVTFLLSATACINFEDGLRSRFPLFIERMVYIPLTVSMLLLLSRLLSAAPQWTGRVLAFVGTVSLELYLIHAHFVLAGLRQYQWGYWLTALATVAVSLPAAWLLHRAIGLLTARLLPQWLTGKR